MMSMSDLCPQSKYSVDALAFVLFYYSCADEIFRQYQNKLSNKFFTAFSFTKPNSGLIFFGGFFSVLTHFDIVPNIHMYSFEMIQFQIYVSYEKKIDSNIFRLFPIFFSTQTEGNHTERKKRTHTHTNKIHSHRFQHVKVIKFSISTGNFFKLIE